jgi:hypothetical protein
MRIGRVMEGRRLELHDLLNKDPYARTPPQ